VGTAGRVSRIEPATDRIAVTVPFARQVDGACYGAGALWVVCGGDQCLWKLDPQDGRVLGKLKLAARWFGDLFFCENRVWVTIQRPNALVAVDPATCQEDGPRLGTGADPEQVVAGGGSLWVLCSGFGGVQRFDARTRALQANIMLDNTWLSGLAFDRDAVWTADPLRGTLTRIDVATNRAATLPYTPASEPGRIAARDGRLVITDRLEYGLVGLVP